MPSATTFKPWGHGSETATGAAEVALASGTDDAWGDASDGGFVRGALDDDRLLGKWSSRAQRDECDEDMAAASASKYRKGQVRGIL